MRWRGTFIELTPGGNDIAPDDHSPRASSDPGSDASMSRHLAERTGHFQAEKEGVSNFSVRMQHVWAQGRSSRSDSDDSRAIEWSKCVSDLSDTNSASGSKFGNAEGPASVALNNMSYPPGLSFPTLTALSVAAAANQSLQNAQGTKRGPQPRNRNRGSGGFKDSQISEELDQKLSTALAVIDGIPEQVREVLQQSARSLADDVQGEVAGVRRLISNCETSEVGAERALERLEVIPDLIINSFGQTLTRMKDNVQKRVDGVIQELDSGGDMEKEKFARHLWSIPEEVLHIAEEAVEEAVQESQALATAQLDYALESAPVTLAENPNTLRNIKNQIMASKIGHLPVTHLGARTIATRSVQNAVAVVHNRKPETTGNETNQTVAAHLLRAKADDLTAAGDVRPLDQILRSREEGLRPPHIPMASEEEPRMVEAAVIPDLIQTAAGPTPAAIRVAMAPEEDRPTNPGSRGHPELCPRPCLYYPLGQCVNGNSCEFCHLPHPKRPVHLDKRHREVLKRMPFTSCAAVILPILRERCVALNLSPEIPHLLDTLEHTSSAGPGFQSVPVASVRADRLLDSALRAMTFRSLLTTLHRAPLPPASAERLCIDAILQRIRVVQDVSLDLG